MLIPTTVTSKRPASLRSVALLISLVRKEAARGRRARAYREVLLDPSAVLSARHERNRNSVVSGSVATLTVVGLGRVSAPPSSLGWVRRNRELTGFCTSDVACLHLHELRVAVGKAEVEAGTVSELAVLCAAPRAEEECPSCGDSRGVIAVAESNELCRCLDAGHRDARDVLGSADAVDVLLAEDHSAAASLNRAPVVAVTDGSLGSGDAVWCLDSVAVASVRAEEHVVALHVREESSRPVARAHVRGDVIVVAYVELNGCCDLLGIAEALGALGSFFSLGEDREQDCCKNGDDSNHDEKFNQSKSFAHGDLEGTRLWSLRSVNSMLIERLQLLRELCVKES